MKQVVYLAVILVMGAIVTATTVTTMVIPAHAVQCDQCFDDLSDSQVQALAEELSDQNNIDFPDTSRVGIMKTICDEIEEGGLKSSDLNKALKQIESINDTISKEFVKCIKNSTPVTFP